MSKYKAGDKKLWRYWDDTSAAYVYYLAEYDPTEFTADHGRCWVSGDYAGDAAWAKRMAKHYKIAFPTRGDNYYGNYED